eukprot:10162282-Karenia_brevis.AAC.1
MFCGDQPTEEELIPTVENKCPSVECVKNKALYHNYFLQRALQKLDYHVVNEAGGDSVRGTRFCKMVIKLQTEHITATLEGRVGS